VNGADGIGDTEGKAAKGSGEPAGRQASFKFVSLVQVPKRMSYNSSAATAASA